MSRGTVELDFFGMEKRASASPQFQKLHRNRSFRDIQSAISKINPEILKSVIVSASSNNHSENSFSIDQKNSMSLPPSPENLISFPPLPVFTPIGRSTSENVNDLSPMTIFYNGTVSVFDIPRDKAESILKLVAEGRFDVNPTVAIPSTDQKQFLPSLDGDLPIARKKSLQRFLEKRKERLTTSSPYACPTPT